MSNIAVLANEATATKRRVYFFIRLAADGLTPASKSAGQPQISTDGGAWTNTGIGTLTDLGNGEHYADVTQAAVLTAGTRIRTRFADVDTIEERGDSLMVGVLDPYTAAALTSAERNAIADALLDRADAIEVGLTLRNAQRLAAAANAGKVSGMATTTVTLRNAVADSKDRVVATVDTDSNRTGIVYDLT